ncbi:MAG TPA: hypothetical protein VF677_02055 [Flavobacterium sp.]|jgi:hypothetical protein
MKNLTIKFSAFFLFAFLFLASCSAPEAEQKSLENTALEGRSAKGTTSENEASRAALTYKVKQYIFQRPNAAFGAGHVGVGYELRTYSNGVQSNIKYYFGSVENSQGSPSVPRGGYNAGWWSTASTGAAMFSIMKNSYGYKNVKFRIAFSNLSDSRRINAYNQINTFPGRGYLVAGNNCMNACWDVLSELATPNVAWVERNYAPNVWYFRTTTGWSSSRAL